MELPRDVAEKYDRQIRLFGSDVQKKILETSVAVLQGRAFGDDEGCSLVAGETIKNAVLLGFGKLLVNDAALASFHRLVPHSIQEMNPNTEATVISEDMLSTLHEKSLIVAMVDQPSDFIGDHVYYLCSACYSFHPAFETHNTCVRHPSPRAIAMECMLGSLFVHEMIKMLRGESYHRNFKLEPM